MNDSKIKRNVLLLILATSIIRIIIASFTGLGPGEAYYFKGALLPNWSYFDQPPLFFWLSTITVKLFGISSLALRLPAILCFAGVIWLLYQTTRHLFGAKAGWYAVVLLNCSFVFTIPVAAWFQPDAPLMFFWLLTAYYLVKLFFKSSGNEGEVSGVPQQSKQEVYKLWILTGIALGLATLSKYHSALLLAGVLIFCVVHKEYRYWFRHPGPYLAVVICIVLSLPIFIWNAENSWVSFVFQGSRAGSSEGFTLYPQFFLRSIIGQALWLAPWIWIPLMIVFVKAFKNIDTQKRQFFIAATAIFPIFIFTIVTLWRDYLFHFHWQAPGYLMLFMLLGERTATRFAAGGALPQKVNRYIRFSAIAAVVVLGLLVIHTETGIFLKGVKSISKQTGIKLKDPTVRGTDYDQIKDLFVEKGWIDNDQLFIGSTRWWQAGKIDWALEGKFPMIIFSRDPRNHAYFVNPQELIGKDAILLAHSYEDTPDYYVKPFFDSMERLDDLPIVRKEITELSLYIYYCKNFQIPKDNAPEIPLLRQLNGLPPF